MSHGSDICKMVSEGMVLTDKEAKTFDGLASLEMLVFDFFEIFST